MKIFLISPVRDISDEELERIQRYIEEQENKRNQVYFPFRDTDQNDNIGLRICQDNRWEIKEADEVHIWWNESSRGSLFDFGMAFVLNKKIIVANLEKVRQSLEKNFVHLLLIMHIRKEIEESDKIHILWKENDEMSLFNFGMTFGLNKNIVLVNPDEVQPTPHKSFANVLLTLHEQSKEGG